MCVRVRAHVPIFINIISFLIIIIKINIKNQLILFTPFKGVKSKKKNKLMKKEREKTRRHVLVNEIQKFGDHTLTYQVIGLPNSIL